MPLRITSWNGKLPSLQFHQFLVWPNIIYIVNGIRFAPAQLSLRVEIACLTSSRNPFGYEPWRANRTYQVGAVVLLWQRFKETDGL